MSSIGEDILRRLGCSATKRRREPVGGNGSWSASELKLLHGRINRIIQRDSNGDDDDRWLAVGFREYVESAGAVSLDAALGLRSARGERSWMERFARQQRDLALSDAVKALDHPAESTLKRAGRLQEELIQFEAGFWHAHEWSKLARPPEGTSALGSALFRYFRAGGS